MLAGGNRGHSSADLVKHNRQNWPSSLWSGRRSLLLLLLLNMIIIPNQPTKSAFDVPLLLCSPTPNTLHRGELPRTTPAGSCLKSEHRRRRPRRKFDHFFGANFTRRRRQSSFFLQLYFWWIGFGLATRTLTDHLFTVHTLWRRRENDLTHTSEGANEGQPKCACVETKIKANDGKVC